MTRPKRFGSSLLPESPTSLRAGRAHRDASAPFWMVRQFQATRRAGSDWQSMLIGTQPIHGFRRVRARLAANQDGQLVQVPCRTRF